MSKSAKMHDYIVMITAYDYGHDTVKYLRLEVRAGDSLEAREEATRYVIGEDMSVERINSVERLS